MFVFILRMEAIFDQKKKNQFNFNFFETIVKKKFLPSKTYSLEGNVMKFACWKLDPIKNGKGSPDQCLASAPPPRGF